MTPLGRALSSKICDAEVITSIVIEPFTPAAEGRPVKWLGPAAGYLRNIVSAIATTR